MKQAMQSKYKLKAIASIINLDSPRYDEYVLFCK